MKNYTEKEICVFNGVMTLCKEGKKIYNITVQDIAKAANMGKGTLYEYFSSKEEIIINALMYFLSCDNARAQQIADSTADFKGKIHSLYDLVLKSFDDGFAMLSQFMASQQIVDFPQLITGQKEFITEVMQLRNSIVMQILQSGVEERVITLDFDADYIRMAIMANLSSLNFCQNLPQYNISVCQIEQKKSYAYTLLLKSLNK